MSRSKPKAEIVIGVDPDCQKIGFAVVENGKLVRMTKLSFGDFLEAMKKRQFDDAVFVVEDANLISGMYQRNRRESPQQQAAIAQSVGRVKEQATCIIAVIKSHGYRVKAVRPMRGNWADPKMKNQFKAATGWTKRSCPETRSAAFFAFMYQDRLDDAA